MTNENKDDLTAVLNAWRSSILEAQPKTIGGYAGAALALEDVDSKHNDRYWAFMTRIGHAMFLVLDLPLADDLRDAGLETVKLLVKDCQRVIQKDKEIRDSYVLTMIAEQEAAGVPTAWLALEQQSLSAAQRLRSDPAFARARYTSLLADAALPTGSAAAPKENG